MTGRRRITLKSSGFNVWDEPPAENYSDVTAMFAHLEPLKIRRDAVIVDVGANIGIYSLSYATLYDASTIYAFEPHPKTYQVLVANIALNDEYAGRIRPLNVGLSNVEGILPISIPSPAIHPRYDSASHQINSGLFSVHGDGGEQVPCSFVPLDSFAQNLPRVDFMKIDVEGWEYEVLEGAERIVDRHRPVISLEYNELTRTLSRYDGRAFETFFQTRGYAMFGLLYGWSRTLEPLAGLCDNLSHVSDLVCIPAERLGRTVDDIPPP